MCSTHSGRLEPVVRVWDGAGRRNGRAYSERCFLIEMDRAVFVEKMDRQTGRDTDRAGQTHGQTSRDHETGPADGQTHCWCWRQARQSRQTIARHRHRHQHRRRHRPGQGTQDGILLFRLRHAENSWGAELSFGSNIGRLRGASGASPKHRQMGGIYSADGQTERRDTDDRYTLR